MRLFFDDFCREVVGCENYIEWEHEYVLEDHGNRHESVMICVSCTKVGQSYNIDAYPDDCPYLKEIKKYEEEQILLNTWGILQNEHI